MADESRAAQFVSSYVTYVKKEMRKAYIREAQLSGVITEAEADRIMSRYRASGQL